MANYYPAFINHILPEINTILRAGEVACYLDISKSSVFRSIQNGKIPARRFGNSVWILRVDILAFENGAGIIPAITRMETNMGKKKAPDLVWVGGRRSTSRAILNIWCDLILTLPGGKARAIVQKIKRSTSTIK